MKLFSRLLESLIYEQSRNGKLRLLVDYLRTAPDPDRGYAMAALCGELSFAVARPALLRALIEERTDPVLFRLSYDFVGDLSETIALMWPTASDHDEPPRLAEVIDALSQTGKLKVRSQIAQWLDTLDETGRWALLKLVTGSMRVGVSELLAKQALAAYGNVEASAIGEVWHGLDAPYGALFDWLDGQAERPMPGERITFTSPMLAQPIDEAELAALESTDFAAEWKWDGIRVQAVARGGDRRLFSRSGEDIGGAFPDLLEALDIDGTFDGELVIAPRGDDGTPQIGTFNDLQQRLNRKVVSAQSLREAPAHLMVYDLLRAGAEDVRSLAFVERRALLEGLIAQSRSGAFSLSPLVDFASWEELAQKRLASGAHPAIEGMMLKRRDSLYVSGRPKGPWFKWKRDPHLLDCVLLYAQRGHGKRSSFYSDYTFGLWQDDKLLPVGKAYFGFTDEELLQIDRHIRNNTTNRFGPVREIEHTRDNGLVFEVAFEGVQQSTRHKSGYAMRFPRINRIRWDKKPGEADDLASLKKLHERMGDADAAAAPL